MPTVEIFRSRLAAFTLVLFALVLRGGPARADDRPLDLSACVRQALARNPQVEDARDAAVIAYLGRDLALDEFAFKAVPSVNGGLQGDNRTNQNVQMLFSRKLLATGTEVSLTGESRVFSSVPQVSVPYFSETRLTVAQPLWRGRSVLENRDHVDEAERRIGLSEHALESTREDLVLQVVRSFYDVVRAEELVGIAEKSLERMNELRDIAQAKLALGSVSKMDVFRAEIHAGRIKNALLDQQARQSAGLDALKALLGIDPQVELRIDSRLQGPSAADLAGRNPEEIALEKRIEILEARDQVQDAERKLLLARYRIWPGVDLVGSYAQQGFGNSFADSMRLNRDEWGVGLRSILPLDRTAERAAMAEAEVILRARERHYQTLRGDVLRQLRDAVRQLRRAEAERTLAAEIADQSEKQAELARFRYEKGVTDNLDLVQAEEQRAAAKGDTVLAAIDEVIAAASVHRAAGTLTEKFIAGAPAAPASEDGAL